MRRPCFVGRSHGYAADPTGESRRSRAAQPNDAAVVGNTGATAEMPNAVKPAAKPADELQLHAVEQGVIERTNAERVRNGLRPFIVDRLLMGQARRHAAWMTRSRSMQHGNYGVGENIAMGQRSSNEVVNTWMNSSGHRANILNAGYNRLGVAAYTTPEGTIYWCQQFRP